MFRRLLTAAVVLYSMSPDLSAADLYAGAGLAGAVEGGSFRQNLEGFTESSGDAWKLLAGVRLGRHVALEIARYDLGSQRCCQGIADLGFTSEVDGTSAAALLRWPLRRFAPFVKGGILDWSEDGEETTLAGSSPRSADGTDLLLGAGLEVDLPASLGIRGEWERYEFDGSSSDSAWATLFFRF